MAGDWIPMRLDLNEDPAVIYMADKLDVREEVVVGYLHKVWSWASRQCHAGSVTNVTLMSLGRVTNLHGFPELMRDAGWLVEGKDDQGVPFIEFPNWQNWLSQSAKKRIQDAKRQQNRRKTSVSDCHADVTEMSRSQRDKSVTTGEESTGKENKESKAAAKPPQVVCVFQTKDGREWAFTTEYGNQLAKTFPQVDVPQQLRQMQQWWDANPAKRKTVKGMKRFVNNWMTTANESAPAKHNFGPPLKTIEQMRAERIARQQRDAN